MSKNGNGHHLATIVDDELARNAKLLAVYNNQTIAEWLRSLIEEAIADNELEITVNGEVVS